MTDMLVQNAVTGQGEHFSIASNLQATLSLATLMLASAAAIFVVPPMASRADFYHGHLNKKLGYFKQPPRAPLLFTWGLIANIFLLLSAVWYLYNESFNAAIDDSAANYYVAVESLLFLVIAFKYFWKGIVWNLHDRTWAMILAGVLAIIVVLVEFILIVLMGVRNVWFSMSFMILVFLINLPLPVWTWILFAFFKKKPKKHRHSDNE